jgi:hypothetical protein
MSEDESNLEQPLLAEEEEAKALADDAAPAREAAGDVRVSFASDGDGGDGGGDDGDCDPEVPAAPAAAAPFTAKGELAAIWALGWPMAGCTQGREAWLASHPTRPLLRCVAPKDSFERGVPRHPPVLSFEKAQKRPKTPRERGDLFHNPRLPLRVTPPPSTASSSSSRVIMMINV